MTCFAGLKPGSISTSTGGSGRGTAEPVDGVLLNPAIVAVLPSKFFAINYNTEQWGITISDNGQEALFPAALAFVRSDVNDFKTQQLSLALSYSFYKMFSIGTTVSMLEYEQPITISEKKYRQTVADVGVMFSPNPFFGVGLVANKVTASEMNLDPLLQKQKTVGFGTQYTYMNFVRFRFDVESAPEYKANRLVYMGGMETFLNDWVIARVGYQNNNVLRKNFVSTGIGFTGPQFGIHYAFISNVADKTEDKHSIDLGVPF